MDMALYVWHMVPELPSKEYAMILTVVQTTSWEGLKSKHYRVAQHTGGQWVDSYQFDPVEYHVEGVIGKGYRKTEVVKWAYLPEL